jgi:hypothetical protein
VAFVLVILLMVPRGGGGGGRLRNEPGSEVLTLGSWDVDFVGFSFCDRFDEQVIRRWYTTRVVPTVGNQNHTSIKGEF